MSGRWSAVSRPIESTIFFSSMSGPQQVDLPPRAGSAHSSSDRHYSGSEKSAETDNELGKPDGATEDGFAPIKPATTTDNSHLQRQSSTASRPVERSWSLNDGYSCNNQLDDEAAAGEPHGAEANESSSEFVVRWDENDPMNPRNFNKVRRWIIVIICSTGSLCV